MRTKIGDVGFMHSEPFTAHQRGGLVSFGHESGLPRFRGLLICVSDLEPRDRDTAAIQPSDSTRKSMLDWVERGGAPDWWPSDGEEVPPSEDGETPAEELPPEDGAVPETTTAEPDSPRRRRT